MIGVGNLEVIHSGTSILYDWDILGSSIYIVDILRIDDLSIDDQSSILRSDSITNISNTIARTGFERTSLVASVTSIKNF